MIKAHSFHIPVMGIGYTIDTPIKVAHLGIDSVISMVDDILAEKIRQAYCKKLNLQYAEIPSSDIDHRAKRFTAYLNLVNKLVNDKFESFKNSAAETTAVLKDYFNLLPNTSKLKKDFNEFWSEKLNVDQLRTWLDKNLPLGSIDVNIMTKVDKVATVGWITQV